MNNLVRPYAARRSVRCPGTIYLMPKPGISKAEKKRSVVNQTSMPESVRQCCLALSSSLGDDKLAFPQSPSYEASLKSYYSAQQQSIRPVCILLPQTTDDVSNAVKILVQHMAPFAIRSGGHTSWAGASNIVGGVTLDLRRLNRIDLTEGGKVVQVGAGATWGVVYEKLDPLGRSVAGGRVAGVGVGGLTLGGGISHLSLQHGWTCDTVRNFEVVLSDGTVVGANADDNSDLYFALRGGGNSFGVVTRIDLETFEQGLLWHASLVCDNSVLHTTIQEFVRLSAAEDYDEYASFLLTFACRAIENPPVYQNLMRLPTLQSSTGLKNTTTAAVETAAMVPNGLRSLYRTVTMVSDEVTLKTIHALWTEAAAQVASIADISWGISFDPVPPSFYARHAEENALGLTSRDGAALLVTLLDVRWSKETDDAFITSTTKTFIEKIELEAKKRGKYDPFVYLNYAGPDQDAIASYGAHSVERLERVRQRVDPAGLFTRQVAGFRSN
ncbi:putative oxidoreductase [Lophiostoma macrostomum CBS 122681]|uniref:Putative oxidoreductase n=1 Tax=Lophiostoma macrostomum CBS 122681 TaxID=1314788 RepID=A0A6A6SU92_9PLEO|nr:putative oxidoreductase [Lophiostoma macrostomum CBS 122681]